MKHQYRVVTLLMGLLLALPVKDYAQPLAAGKSKFLGNVISNGNSIRASFLKYWNQVTPENAGKWASVEGGMDAYNWTQLDKIYNYAIVNQFHYKHHALVWGQQYPAWITSLDSAAQRAQVEEWIRLVGERYPDMDMVDVVNEPFNAPPPFAKGLGGNGVTGYDWVVTAFELARKYCAPGVILILNEYNVLHSNSTTNKFLALIDTLKVRGLIDAVGIQGHYFEFKSPAGATPSYSYPLATIKGNLDKLATTGLPIYISEFDINEADDATQLSNYQTYFPLFWEHPGVKGMTLWGYVQEDIWKVNAYLLTSRGAERPAMKWLRTYILTPIPPILIAPKGTFDESQSPVLTWHASESAIDYRVQVSQHLNFATFVLDTTVADTVLAVQALQANTRYHWRVSAANASGVSACSATASFTTGAAASSVKRREGLPLGFELAGNYPNPFNPATNIVFKIPRDAHVELSVSDLLGRRIATLVNGKMAAGGHTVPFIASDIHSGSYFYTLKVEGYRATRRMVFIK